MNTELRAAFAREMTTARAAYAEGSLDAAFRHFERAHILSQRYALRHALTHAWMLRVGWARGDAREVVGQVVRIAAAVLFSRIWVPVGNTGGANVSALRPMPVPEDLRTVLEGDG